MTRRCRDGSGKSKVDVPKSNALLLKHSVIAGSLAVLNAHYTLNIN